MRFRPAAVFGTDSELMRINDPGRRRVEVAGRPAADALGTALRAAHDTGGLVDPTIGRCLIDLGYDRSFELLTPAQPLIGRATHTPAWEHVSVRRLEARVPLAVRLDLGATAKALCADRAAEKRASIVSGCGVLVSLGGDIAVAGQAPEDGWAIRVADRADVDPASGPGQTIAVREGGLATSGVAARRWAQEGQVRHHLIDPRTATPAIEIWRTVSVAAANCVEANVASTAAVIVGGPAPEWLARRGAHARLVGVDGEVVFVGGWPAGTEDHSGDVSAHRLATASPGGGVINALLGAKATWYLMRASGFVAFGLLTITLALGVAERGPVGSGGMLDPGRRRPRSPQRLPARCGLPRHPHRHCSQRQVRQHPHPGCVRPRAVRVRPAVGRHRGAVSLDVMAALIVSSLLRERLSRRGWKAVHWFAYLAWPTALVHSIGAGTGNELDTGHAWSTVIYVLAVLVVAGAIAVRLAARAGAVRRAPAHPRLGAARRPGPVLPAALAPRVGPGTRMSQSASPAPVAATSREPGMSVATLSLPALRTQVGPALPRLLSAAPDLASHLARFGPLRVPAAQVLESLAAVGPQRPRRGRFPHRAENRHRGFDRGKSRRRGQWHGRRTAVHEGQGPAYEFTSSGPRRPGAGS